TEITHAASITSSHSHRRGGRHVVIVVTLALLAVACGTRAGGEDAAGADSTKSAPIVHARIERVSAAPFTETIGAIGVVAPRAGHVATLSAPGAARVARVLVGLGDHVPAGASLVVLDAAPFRAALQSAE